MSQIHGKQIKTASIGKDILALIDPVNNLDPATKQWVLAQIQSSLFTQNWKSPVRVAVGTNVTISAPGATLDGVSMVAGDRFLAYAQSTGSQNGSYVWNGAGVAATRTTDFNEDTEAIDGAVFPINEGTLADKYYKLTTNNPIVLGTTALVFSDLIPTTASAVPSASNKDMAATITTTDFDQACATQIVGTPTNDGYVRVLVNGIGQALGDGVRTKDCYFSSDTGATAKTIANVASGDRLYWVGSVAGFQLAANDKVDFDYSI